MSFSWLDRPTLVTGATGLVGAFGDHELRLEPPLFIDPLDVRSNIVQVKGRTEPGATVTVNGQRVDVQEDGSFNEFITLQEPGKQLVIIRSTGINGGVNEQKRTVIVAY